MFKKILIGILILFCLGIDAQSQVQGPDVPVRLINSSGVPITGQAGNMTFRKSPFGTGDVIAGITVTEHGTQGNYTATGFTTYQLTKMFWNGTEQVGWGGTNGLFTGNSYNVFLSLSGGTMSGDLSLGNHALNNYSNLFGLLNASTQTWTGLNYFYGLQTFLKYPYLEPTSTWMQNGNPPFDNSIVWKKWVVDNFAPSSGNQNFLRKDIDETYGHIMNFYGHAPKLTMDNPNYPPDGHMQAYRYYTNDPRDSMLAVNKWYVDSAFYKRGEANAIFLKLSGGTMTGDLDMGGLSLTGLADPTTNLDAISKGWANSNYARLQYNNIWSGQWNEVDGNLLFGTGQHSKIYDNSVNLSLSHNTGGIEFWCATTNSGFYWYQGTNTGSSWMSLGNNGLNLLQGNYLLNGNNINTAGTLTNLAYLNASNNFTGSANKIIIDNAKVNLDLSGGSNVTDNHQDGIIACTNANINSSSNLPITINNSLVNTSSTITLTLEVFMSGPSVYFLSAYINSISSGSFVVNVVNFDNANAFTGAFKIHFHTNNP
jgi:hypothetical protein